MTNGENRKGAESAPFKKDNREIILNICEDSYSATYDAIAE